MRQVIRKPVVFYVSNKGADQPDYLNSLIGTVIIPNLESSMAFSEIALHAIADVLKFPTLVACQNGPHKQGRPRSDCFWRSSLIKVCPVCSSEMSMKKSFITSSMVADFEDRISCGLV